MKRIEFIMIGLFMFCLTSANAQVIFNETFEEIACVDGVGAIPTTWTMYNDKNKVESVFGKYNFDTYSWRVGTDGSRKYAISPSFFVVPAKADRWMIIPEIDLSSAQNPYLVNYSKAEKSTNRDGYSVLISSTGVEKSAFTGTLQSINSEKASWTQHINSLSEYKGKKINVAFVQNTEDKYAILMDDIVVYDVTEDTKLDFQLFIPKAILSSSTVSIQGLARNLGKKNITSFVLNYTVNGGAPIKTTFGDLSISTLQDMSVSAPSWDPASYGSSSVHLVFWLSDINNSTLTSNKITFDVEVVSPSQLPTRSALLEGFSSGTCSPCRTLNTVLHKVLPPLNPNVLGSGFMVVKYQVEIPDPGDPAVTEETKKRARHYKVAAAPSLYMGGQFFEYSTVESEMATIVKTKIDEIKAQKSEILLNSYYVLQDKTFDITADIESYLPMKDPCNIYAVILEDSIYHAPSTNGESIFFYIARKILPGADGESIDLSEAGVSQTRKYSFEFDGVNPTVFGTVEGMTVLVFVQNTKTLEILQAAVAVKSGVNTENGKKMFGKVFVTPNPSSANANSQITVTLLENTNMKVDVYNTVGRKVWSKGLDPYNSGINEISLPNDLEPNTYFISLRTTDGVSKTLKWIKL